MLALQVSNVIVTEEDARSMACPMAISGGGDSCLGSSCMAWRRGRVIDTERSQPGRLARGAMMVPVTAYKESDRGYCGMVYR